LEMRPIPITPEGIWSLEMRNSNLFASTGCEAALNLAFL
jgi:hypothetical protein